MNPPDGSTATAFAFSVNYSTSNDIADIWVEVGGTRIDLEYVDGSGTFPSGTYQQSAFIAAGTHAVTFFADVNGPDVETLAIPDLVVSPGPTPTPGATPPPTPTPVPTATPVPTPTPTPLPPGVTPRPTPRPTPLPPGVTPRPGTPTPEASAGESQPAASGSIGPSDSSEPGASESSEGEGSPSPDAAGSADATPAASASAGDEKRGGFGQVGWIVLGGMTSVAGAAVLGRQWMARRRS